MPNYIYNRLGLECEQPSILDRFYEENRVQNMLPEHKFGFHDETVLSFSCQVPVGKGDDEIMVWGCKWDASNPEYTRLSLTKSEYRFTTPWNAPMNWLRSVSKKYSEIKFTIWYECEGLLFIGAQSVINGVCSKVFKNRSDYHLRTIPQYFKYELGIDLAELYNRITIAANGNDLALELDEEDNNIILDRVIEELGLNREFGEVKACVVRDIYMSLRGKLDIDCLTQYN
jgi:hypothetical protein